MGRKVKWMLELPGFDVAALRVHLGLRSRSAPNEWMKTGRVAKGHISAFARATGTTERWWLVDEAPVPPTDEWLAGGEGMKPSGQTAVILQMNDMPISAMGLEVGRKLSTLSEEQQKTLGAMILASIAAIPPDTRGSSASKGGARRKPRKS